MFNKPKVALYGLITGLAIFPVTYSSIEGGNNRESDQNQQSSILISSIFTALIVGLIIALVLSLLIPTFITFMELLGLTVVSSWMLINTRLLIVAVGGLGAVGTGVYRYIQYR